MPDRLPWEHEGTPFGAGVCLSGGGIRAAIFALGAAQALQQFRGLLVGPRCARLLAAVSGGSYTAAAYVLNIAELARQFPGGPPPGEPAPLHPDSPESHHIVANGEYLLHGGRGRTAATAAGLLVINTAAFLVLFVWLATFFGLYAVVAPWLLVPLGSVSDIFLLPLDPDPDRQWMLAVVACFGGALAVRGLYVAGGWRRQVWPLVGVLLVVVGGSAFRARVSTVRPLSDPMWWHPGTTAAALVAAAAGFGALWWGLARLRWTAAARTVVRVAAWLPRLLGIVVFAQTAIWSANLLQAGTDPATGVSVTVAALIYFFAVVIGGVMMISVSARASLHRLNRNRIARCFAVVRHAEDVRMPDPVTLMLSKHAPPREGTAWSFPRLLICATANVIWHFPGGTTRTYAPFVISHDLSGIPGLRGAHLSTPLLERERTAAGLWPMRSTEPLLSMMSAVACTGAAVSPAMGRYDFPFRSLVALLNVRLGRWLFNPMSAAVRRAGSHVPPGSMPKYSAFGAGYDEFLPELLSLHRPDGPRLYISDGGHYDNTGLLALLAGRCRTIWCVDAEADRRGAAHQLREVVALAEEELGVRIEIDLETFRSVNDELLGASHAIGHIQYPEGVGTLIVMKLGLTADTPAELRDYRSVDPPFPFHSTVHVAFPPARMNAYRQLGFATAEAALRSVSADR